MISNDSEQFGCSRPLVLLVEDDLETCLLLVRAMSHVGYSVRTASDGQEALDGLADERPQLVIVDLWMPRMDGMTLIDLVRQHEATLPILAISAGVPTADLSDVPFLQKPFAIAVFLDTVGRLLPLTSPGSPASVASGSR